MTPFDPTLPFVPPPERPLAPGGEIIVDLFAGGGGASLGIEMALGRLPDVAVNHDDDAIAMHAANHPATWHLCRNVWQAAPDEIVRRLGGRRVGLLWASPDCKHFSKAKGGRPVKRSIRDLAWVVVLWARRARPRVICLENVEEFRDWGPLVVRADGGLWPCADRKGETFERWAGELRRLGYRVEWRELRACDYGAPTIRKRLLLVARCDGRPIAWPEPTHGRPDSEGVRAGCLLPWRTAAEIIDWSLPCPSIFLTREEGRRAGVNRPLVDVTMARIARGVRRYVLDAAEPFIVPVTHAGDLRSQPVGESLRTITTAHRGEQALVAPVFVPRYGERPGQDPRAAPVTRPMATVVPTGNGASLVAAFLAQHNTGMTGHDARAPVSTIVGKGCTQGLAAMHLLNLKGAGGGPRDAAEPLATVCAGGNHAFAVAAFLQKYYGTGGQDQAAGAPLHTQPTRDRFGLVTVTIAGEPFALVDIGMRMLTPRELFRAQGFPDTYDIACVPTKTAQIRLCGNSVPPPMAAAIVRANAPELADRERVAA